MVPTTFIALRGLGTSHPGVCRAEGLLEAPGAVQGKTARMSHLPASSPGPLVSLKPYSISQCHPPHPQPRPVSEIGLSPTQVFCVQQEASCFFYSLFRLSLCLPVSRKVPFFCRGFVCMRLGESHSPQNGPELHFSPPWASALCPGPHSTLECVCVSPFLFPLSCPPYVHL